MTSRWIIPGLFMIFMQIGQACAQTDPGSMPSRFPERGGHADTSHKRVPRWHAREREARRHVSSRERLARKHEVSPASPVVKTVGVPPPPLPPKPPVGLSTGLPLPRFAALRADEVNMRAGPGTQYPIDWVFKRQDMPVEIEREFDVWRLVEAPDGTKGWVHQATLVGSRMFFVPGVSAITLHEGPDPQSPAVATLDPGVIGRLVFCKASEQWCRVSVGGRLGYLQRTTIWGVLPGEVIGNAS